MPLPEAIRNAPELCAGLELFYQGFLDLATHRQASLGTSWIPTLAIFDYCDRIGLEGEQRQDFVDVIKRLDFHYLEWNRGKQPGSVREKDGGEGSQRKRARR